MTDLGQHFHRIDICFLQLMLLSDSTSWSYFLCLSGNSVILNDWFFFSQSIFYGISESMNEVALVLSFKGMLFKKSSVQCLKKHVLFQQC